MMLFPPYEVAIQGAFHGQDIIIKGSGFVPRTTIWLTICEANWILGDVEVNDCGAFELVTPIPSECSLGVVSVKAWSPDFPPSPDAVLQATWPLDIYEMPP